MPTSTSNQDTEELQLHISNCLEKLKRLQEIVSKRQWDNLENHVNDYQHEISLLQQCISTFSTPPLMFTDAIKNLSYQQRRIMRAINENMQLTSEDIDSVNKGIKRLERIETLSKEI